MQKNQLIPFFEPRQRFLLGMGTLVFVFLVVTVLAAGSGAVSIPFREVLSILRGHLGLIPGPRYWRGSDEVILLHIRFPRVLGAALVGAALSVAGTLFQGLLRNPM